MVMKNPFSQYVDNQVNTATPERLIVLAYEGAIRFSRTGLEAMRTGKLDEQSAAIGKAQAIITELRACLDEKANPQLAASLASLYSYLFDRLTDGNIHDKPEAVEEVIGLMTDLRSAWAEAEIMVRSGRLTTQEAQAA